MASFATSRETIAWVLQLQGDLGASAETTAAKVEKLGLSADQAKLKVKELDAAQAAASKESAAWTKNLLGVAGVVSTVAIGLGIATGAAEKFVSSVVNANSHLREIGIGTGRAGAAVDNYANAVDKLTISWEKLELKLGEGPITRLEQLASAMTKVTDAAGTGGFLDSVKRMTDRLSSMGLLFATGGTAAPVLLGMNQAGRALDSQGAGGGAIDRLLSTPAPGQVYQAGGVDVGSFFGSSSRGRAAVTPVDLNALRMAMAGGHGAPSLAFGATSPTGVQSVSGGLPYGMMGPGFAQTTGAESMGGGGGGLNASAIAGGISALGSGSASSALALAGPPGMIAGAVASIAPVMGKTFDGLIKQVEHLPSQLVRGISHILDALPDVIGKTLPDLVISIVGMIPTLVGALAESLPQIIKAALVDLPKALAEAIAAFLTGDPSVGQSIGRGGQINASGRAPRNRQQAQDAFNNSVFMGSADGSFALARQGGGVHVHVHGGNSHDVIRRIRKELGSYGSGESLDALVTS